MAASTAPTPRGELVDYAQFVDDQMARARGRIKSVEVLAAGTVLAAVVLGYLLVMVILDHVLAHGLPRQLRLVSLVGLGVALAAYAGWFVVRPAARRINTLYAARTVERAEPRFKNSLITFLQLRGKTEVPEPILEAVEEKAAADLAQIRVEASVSQERLIRGWYALAAVVVLCCFYIFIAPKSPFISVGRVLFPYADVLPPTKTQITEVRPGDDPEKSRVVAGANVEISGLVTGRMPDDVELYWRTLDGEFPRDGVELARPESKYDRWKTTLRGVEQSFEYFLQGGDHRTKLYRVEVLPAPVAKVVSVSYRFPEYMGMPPLVVADGNISAWDGTEVTIEARTSEPAARASLVLGNKNDERPMQVGRNPQELSIRLPLRLEDATQEENSTYRIWFTTSGGARNPNPVAYELRIRPDNPPEVAIRRPGRDLDLPANGLLPLEIEAVDDFGVRSLVLHAVRGKERLLDRDLREHQPPQREVRLAHTLDLAKLKLSDGDQIEYWVEARDNRAPTPGVRESARYRITVTSPVPEKERQEQLAQADDAQKKLQEETQRAKEEAEKQREPGEGEQRQSPASEGQHQSRRDGEGSGEPQRSAEGQKDDATRDRDALRKLVDHFKGARQAREAQEDRSRAEEKPANGSKQDQGENREPKKKGQPQDPKRAETQKEGKADRKAASGKPAKQGKPEQDQGAGDKPDGESKQPQEKSDGKAEGGESSGADGGPSEKAGKSAEQEGSKPGANKQEQQGGSSSKQQSGKKNEDPGKAGKGASGSPSGRQERNRAGGTAKKGESAGEQGQPGESKAPDGKQGRERSPSDSRGGSDAADDRAKEDSADKQGPGARGKPEGKAADKRVGDAADGEEQKPDDPGAGGAKKEGGKRDANAGREQGDAQGDPKAAGKAAGGQPQGAPQSQPGTPQSGAKPGEQSGKASKRQEQGSKGEPGKPGEKSAGGASQSQPKPGEGEQAAGSKQPSAGKGGGDKSPPSGAGDKTDKNGSVAGPTGKGSEAPSKRQERSTGAGKGAGGKPQDPRGDAKKEPAGTGSQGTAQGGQSTEGQAEADSAKGTKATGGDKSPAGAGGAKSPAGAQGDKGPAGAGAEDHQGGASGQGPKTPAGGQPGGQAPSGARPGGEPGGQGHGAGVTSPGKTGDKAPDDGRQPGSGKPGDGQADAAGADSTEPGGDPANPNYTREAAELVLEKLGHQLERDKVDPELLKKLGWTKEQLAEFVKRYRGKPEAIPLDDPWREAELAKTAEQLKLKKGTMARAPGKVKGDDNRGLSEALETPPPPELKKVYDTYNLKLNRYRSKSAEK